MAKAWCSDTTLFAMAVLWLDQFDSALHQIQQGRYSRGLLCLRETFHFLLGISLASCPQEMPWQEQELGNDELSPESQG